MAWTPTTGQGAVGVSEGSESCSRLTYRRRTDATAGTRLQPVFDGYRPLIIN